MGETSESSAFARREAFREPKAVDQDPLGPNFVPETRGRRHGKWDTARDTREPTPKNTPATTNDVYDLLKRCVNKGMWMPQLVKSLIRPPDVRSASDPAHPRSPNPRLTSPPSPASSAPKALCLRSCRSTPRRSPVRRETAATRNRTRFTAILRILGLPFEAKGRRQKQARLLKHKDVGRSKRAF